MSDELEAVFSRGLRRLTAIVKNNPDLLAEVRRLASRFLSLTDPAKAESGVLSTIVPVAESIADNGAECIERAAIGPRHEPLPNVPGVEVPSGWSERLIVSHSDLGLIEARCRLKAEGARWAATRQRRINAGASFRLEIEPVDREIIARAKALEGCFLWMNHSSCPIPRDPRTWEEVAGCFEATAMALAILQVIVEDAEKLKNFLEPVFDLAAEAQSALRMAIDAAEGKPDSDQQMVYRWLQQAAVEQQLFIQRYMRLDDPADPTVWNSLQERITKVEDQIGAIRRRESVRMKLLSKGRYHARRIEENTGTDVDWARVVAAVDGLVEGGIPPSNTDIRDMLVPIIDDMPEIVVSTNVQRVLAEIDRYFATRVPVSYEQAKSVESTVKIQKVAKLLAGKVVVIIGGDRRPYAYEALKSAFKLKDLIWIATREHESVDRFEPHVARPEVDTVLLAIRWSSHSYGEVREFCKKHGKRFVRLPGGYNPNQVAHQILQQR